MTEHGGSIFLSGHPAASSKRQGVINMVQVKDSRSESLLDEFALDEDVAELAVVDDLWYFVVKNGNWIAGSG